jgi:hypothetical protein
MSAEITKLMTLLFKMHRTCSASNEVFKLDAFCPVPRANQEINHYGEEGRVYSRKLEQDKHDNEAAEEESKMKL